MSLEQIVVTGCPTCGAMAQAIAEGEGVSYRHIDAATLRQSADSGRVGGAEAVWMEHAETILRSFGYTDTANNIRVVIASITELVAADKEYDAAQAEQTDSAKFDENGMYVPRSVFDRMKAATTRRSAALAALGQGEAVAWAQYEEGQLVALAFKPLPEGGCTTPLYTHPAPAASPAGPIDKHTTGLYRKFEVTRTDGSSAPGGKHHGCEYFVLDMTHDPFAKPAAAAYADACEPEYASLAADMRARYELTAASPAGVPDGAVLYANVHAFNGKNDGCVTVRKRDEFFTVPLYTRPIQESGWLIEAWDSKRNELKAKWWSVTHDGSCDEHWDWVSDSTRALRFARECDAQAYIKDMGWTEAKPTEHEWSAAPSAKPAGVPDRVAASLTAAMREADKTFERVGGSTRHYVRDCLLPILEKHGLRLTAAAPSAPIENAGVPDGWLSMPREALMYVSDLLAERKYGTPARSPAHNARIVVDYWLAAAPSAPEGGEVGL